MTAIQLNAELAHELSLIANDETLLAKVLKYVKKITAKKEDDTLMTKEEFLAKIKQAEEEYQKGETYAMLPGESFHDFRKRIGR